MAMMPTTAWWFMMIMVQHSLLWWSQCSIDCYLTPLLKKKTKKKTTIKSVEGLCRYAQSLVRVRLRTARADFVHPVTYPVLDGGVANLDSDMLMGHSSPSPRKYTLSCAEPPTLMMPDLKVWWCPEVFVQVSACITGSWLPASESSDSEQVEVFCCGSGGAGGRGNRAPEPPPTPSVSTGFDSKD